MSEYSVKNISKLPMLFPEKRGGLARSLMLKVLAKLQVGSLTLKEQGETLVFGSQTDPACWRAANQAVSGHSKGGASLMEAEAKRDRAAGGKRRS